MLNKLKKLSFSTDAVYIELSTFLPDFAKVAAYGTQSEKRKCYNLVLFNMYYMCGNT